MKEFRVNEDTTLLGFVSNSSSANYILDLEEYPNADFGGNTK